jgi:hypothetical protein
MTTAGDLEALAQRVADLEALLEKALLEKASRSS